MSHCSVVETLARYKRGPIPKAIGDRNDRITAYDEGVGVPSDDFKTLPAHVKAIYPKLNRAASSKIVWAYNEGGEGRPTMPNTSDYTKESGYPMKRTASHHSGDYGWAVKQIQELPPGYNDTAIDKILKAAQKDETSEYTMKFKPYMKTFKNLDNGINSMRHHNSRCTATWDLRTDDDVEDPKFAARPAFKTHHIKFRNQDLMMPMSPGMKPFNAGGTLRKSTTPHGPSVMTLIQTRSASPDQLQHQYSFTPDISRSRTLPQRSKHVLLNERALGASPMNRSHKRS